jgi:hypothetical protein
MKHIPWPCGKGARPAAGVCYAHGYEWAVVIGRQGKRLKVTAYGQTKADDAAADKLAAGIVGLLRLALKTDAQEATE